MLSDITKLSNACHSYGNIASFITLALKALLELHWVALLDGSVRRGKFWKLWIFKHIFWNELFPNRSRTNAHELFANITFSREQMTFITKLVREQIKKTNTKHESICKQQTLIMIRTSLHICKSLSLHKKLQNKYDFHYHNQ